MTEVQTVQEKNKVDQNIQPQSQRPVGKLAALIIVLLILLAGLLSVALILKHHPSQTKTTDENQINAIRSNFLTQSGTSPQIQGAETNQPAEAPTQNEVMPRGEDSGHPTPPATSTALAAQNIYKNTSLGFQMEISNIWQATQSGDSSIAFANARGQNITVESYPTNGEDLSIVQTQLEGSPDVTNIHSTNFAGEAALTYSTANDIQGIAVIHNNKVYFISGKNLTEPPVSTFNFLP